MTEAGGTPAAGGSAGQASGSPADLTSVLRSRGYHTLLLAAALIGLPIALIAFGFAVVLMLEVVGFAGRQVLLVPPTLLPPPRRRVCSLAPVQLLTR